MGPIFKRETKSHDVVRHGCDTRDKHVVGVGGTSSSRVKVSPIRGTKSQDVVRHSSGDKHATKVGDTSYPRVKVAPIFKQETKSRDVARGDNHAIKVGDTSSSQ